MVMAVNNINKITTDIFKICSNISVNGCSIRNAADTAFVLIHNNELLIFNCSGVLLHSYNMSDVKQFSCVIVGEYFDESKILNEVLNGGVRL